MKKRKIIVLFSFIMVAFLLVACGRQVTITFVTNGGDAIADMTIDQSTTIDAFDATRTGYTFEGWFLDETFSNTFEFADEVTRNITLYAKWSINTYELTFHFNNDEDNLIVSGEYNATIAFPENPTKTGYIFNGWYTDIDCTNSFSNTRIPGSSLDLYAGWTQIILTVNFYMDIDDEEPVAIKDVAYGSTVETLPAISNITGYHGYWDFDETLPVTEDLIVYAKYEINIYTVTIEDDFGTVYESLEVAHGDLIVPTVTPQKDGYTFIGYNQSLSSPVENDMTLLVVYQQDVYRVSFYGGANNTLLVSRNLTYGQAATAPTNVDVSGYTFSGWDKDFDNVKTDLSIYAIYEPIVYDIVLHASNGQFSNLTNELTISKDYKALIGTVETPTLPGYTFSGWYSNELLTTPFTFGPSTTMPLDGLTLYAKWVSNQYSINYDANGGSVAVSSKTVYYDALVGVLAAPTRTGYTFNGWYNDDNQLINKDTLYQFTTSIDVTAQWTPIVYLISYTDLYGTASVNINTYDIETPTTTLNNPSNRVGYTFMGWYKADQLITEIAQGTYGNITLTAHWQLIEYTLTYDNLFESSQSNPAVYNINTATFNLTDPAARVGYTFIGWYDALVDGQAYESITKGLATDLTLYAHWSINSYKLTFNDDNNTELASYTYDYNTDLSGFVTPSDPEKTGYTFSGWDIIVPANMPSNDLVFTATYTINSYTITFDSDGGSDVSLITANYHSQIQAPEVPIKTGFSFGGWLDESDNIYVFNLMPASNMTLTAVWTEWAVLTMDLNDGVGQTTLSQAPGTDLIQPINPTKVGYIFDGWFSDDLLTVAYVFDVMPVSDQTIYAAWHVDTFSITYSNLFDTTHSNPLNYTIGTTTFTLSDPSTRLGYTFVGWFNQTVGGLNFDEISLGSYGDITLYARWQVVTYELTYEQLFTTTHTNPLTYNITTQSFTLSNPSTRLGYTFDGWYDASTGGNAYTQIVLGSTGNMTLYAHWSVVTYDISYSQLFDTTHDNPTTFNIETPTFTLNDPSDREGYNFVGWYDSQTGGTQITEVTIGSIDDIDLFAHWEPKAMTVTLDYQYDDNHDIRIVYYLELLAEETPVRQGYDFMGWYADENFVDTYDFNQAVTQNMTIYAKWELSRLSVFGTSYFDQEDIASDQLSFTGTTSTSDSSEDYIAFNDVFYGDEMTPYRDIEGYEFYKYIYDGTDIYDQDYQFIILENTQIDIVYHRISVTVTFTEVVDSIYTSTPYYVYYDDEINTVPVPTPITGYTTEWERSNFTILRENLEVAAISYSNSVQTIIFKNNDITIFIATNSESNPLTEFLSSSSPLWNLAREGYRFDGWKYTNSLNEEIYLTQNDLVYGDFEDTIVIIEAQWYELQQFDAPEITDISVSSNDESIQIVFDVTPVMIDDVETYPTDFYFIINDITIDDITSSFVRNGSTVTLTILTTDDDYLRFNMLLEAGTHEIEIIAKGVTNESYRSEVSETYLYLVQSIYDTDPQDVAIYDYLIIENYGNGTKRYVFYTDLEYQFSATTTFDILLGDTYVSANGNVLTTNSIPGSFKFRITTPTTSTIYEGLVVQNLMQFSYDTSYQTYLSNTSASTTNYLNTDFSPYYVGNQNTFYLDIRLLDNSGSRVDLADVDLNYTFYIVEGATLTEIAENDLETFVAIDDENNMQFTALALGMKFKIEVEPQYQATMMAFDTLSYLVEINDGYNAFTNAQLKSLFSNLNVTTINILRNIKAELLSNQKNADGSPINLYAHESDSSGYGNVYSRISNNVNDDQVQIEGNYMTIDGSDLPISNANSGSGTIGYSQSFDIINVQIGIFYYNVLNSATYVFSDDSNADNDYINDNQFSMNNLTIISNTTTPSVNYGGTATEISSEERLMSENSGGYLGVVIRSGEGNFNNMNMGSTTIAFTLNAFGQNSELEPLYTNISYVHIYNSWANSIYLNGGSGLVLTNSQIESSGGAAIHFEDTHSGDGYATPALIMDRTNAIENWISGQEAWFKAYGMSAIALTLKSGIESNINGIDMTTTKVIQNPVTGLDTEMMNLIFLSLPQSGAVTYSDPVHKVGVLTGSEINLVITDDVNQWQVLRSYDFLNSGDPRIIDSMYGFPLGALSETAAFYTMVSELMSTYGLDSTTAANGSTIAAFYNLTASQTATTLYYIGQGYGITAAVEAALGGSITTFDLPNYIEVDASVVVGSSSVGFSTILIEIFNINDMS
ncbi:MAG: InlB B-repeat-containing protein [Acholeplasmataceae bacterium]